MPASVNRIVIRQIAAIVFLLVALTSAARADIHQWEYINPLDPSQGKRQSPMLAPDGAGVDAVPGAVLMNRDLNMAYLMAVDLTDADLRQANLTNAHLHLAKLTDANFSGAEVRAANFDRNAIEGTGITPSQLYSTATYQAGDLSNMSFTQNNLAGGNFTGKNLTNASFYGAALTDADFREANLTNANFSHATLTGAEFIDAQVRGANFTYTTFKGLTLTRLYSTASYRAKDLSGMILHGNDLAGGNFVGQDLSDATFDFATLTGADFSQANLTNVSFLVATLTDADLSGAEVRGARFPVQWDYSTSTYLGGISQTQLYSTASYQAHDLTGISLRGNRLANVNLAGQNLTEAGLGGADLTGADFRKAKLTGVDFDFADLTDADFREANLTSSYWNSTNLARANFHSANLTNAQLPYATLTDADFREANLTNADFGQAAITAANFMGAEVRGASFSGMTLPQLYATASYQVHDLTGIALSGDLRGANFAGQILTNASFGGATLTDADFREANLTNAGFGWANLTGASFREANLANADFSVNFCPFGSCQLIYAVLAGADLTAADARGAFLNLPASAITKNLIRPDGLIEGLVLDADGLLLVRDYDGYIAITVDEHLIMGPGGTLRMVFEADAWDSTISFAPGIPVELGGALELTFASGVDVASQRGRTFDLFNWDGVTPTGTFAVATRYRWDLSNLYTTGEVTMLAVPEPSTLFLMPFASAAIHVIRRAKPRYPGHTQLISRRVPSAWPAACSVTKPRASARRLIVSQRSLVAAVMFPVVAIAASAHADIYQWEYINPADASQGKRPSTTLAPDGAGVDAVPGAKLYLKRLRAERP